MILHFPMPPNLGNARMHWTTKHRGRKMYLAKCDQLVGRPSGYPITQCDVTVTLHLCGTLMDADNAAARCKFPLDFLVTRGWLKDDGPHVIQSFTVKQVREPRRADVRLVIEIQEAA